MKIALLLTLLSSLCFGAETSTTEKPRAVADRYRVQAEGGGAPNRVHSEKISSVNAHTAYAEAMRECEDKLKSHPDHRSCEPVLLDDEQVATAAQLRGRALKETKAGEARKLSLFRFTSPKGSVFIYGSVHLMKKNAYPLHPAISGAFASSDNLVLEVDLSAIPPLQLQSAFASRGMYSGEQSLVDALGPETTALAEQVLSSRGISLQAYAGMRPWLFEQTIIMQEMLLYGFDPQAGIDSHFDRQARQLGKRVLQLETLEQQLDLLSNSSLDDQLFSLSYTLESLKMRTMQAELNALVVDWLQGDINGLFEQMMQPLQEFPRLAPYMKALFDDRNIVMAENIERWMEKGGSYFVVVGAGHLGGQMGVVNLLRERGFSLEQVAY